MCCHQLFSKDPYNSCQLIKVGWSPTIFKRSPQLKISFPTFNYYPIYFTLIFIDLTTSTFAKSVKTCKQWMQERIILSCPFKSWRDTFIRLLFHLVILAIVLQTFISLTFLLSNFHRQGRAPKSAMRWVMKMVDISKK